MGMILSVYRNSELVDDCTRNGISSRFTKVCALNVEGPFEPNENTPAVFLESHVPGCLRIVPVKLISTNPKDEYIVDTNDWYMFGGNYAATSDSRFREKCEDLLGTPFYGAVAIHDRVE